eukprot:SAG25_NODE_1534_length_2831_cov_3.062592_2_plen_98_part_00
MPAASALQNNVIPDGWFEYPGSVNSARRKLRTWLLQRQDDGNSRGGGAIVLCPPMRAFCRPTAIEELELVRGYCLAACLSLWTDVTADWDSPTYSTL